MRAVTNDSRADRRGVTLMEMLVTVALLVLVMSILVAIFRSATEAITIHQVTSVLDQDLRRIDTMVRQDLDGITATLTPPLNPKDYRGYFSYGENEIADSQGEDADDWLAFTAKAPAGLPFVGYVTVPVTGQGAEFGGMAGTPRNYQRVAIKSDYAEVIYFLRNHTLYRRIFLILPQGYPLYVGADQSLTNGQGAILNSGGFYLSDPSNGIFASGGTSTISWQYLNDVSARPAPGFPPGTGVPVPNSLSDLTQPHNRAFRRRFCDDYVTATTGAAPPDGNTDDVNNGTPDGIPDFYPTMYAGIFSASNRTLVNWYSPAYVQNDSAFAPLPVRLGVAGNYDVLGFPYEFPGAFPNPNPPVNILGPMHIARADSTGTVVINHAPLQIGDPLGYPTLSNGLLQTYWGFPTKKEMRSSSWDDPVHRLNVADPLDNALLSQAPGLSLGVNQTLLPPMSSPYRLNPEPFVEATPAGSDTFALSMGDPPGLGVNKPLWKSLIDDDAIATNVRSFDIKVLDPNSLIYQDLGYGDVNNPDSGGNNNLPANLYVANYLLQGFSHEGRMPPLTGDLRLDAQFPSFFVNGAVNYNNVGDDNAGVRRLRRVYDTWSTDYSNPPWQTLDPRNWPGYPSPLDTNVPPVTANPPPLPGFPPPYPAQLRSMQIQVRFVDPRNERLKVLTIRHDFTDNL